MAAIEEPRAARGPRDPVATYDSKLRSEWAILQAPDKTHARSTGSTQYWCAPVALSPKLPPGAPRTVNVKFDATCLADGMAVGMVPSGLKKEQRADREDHMGRQVTGGIGVWSDGSTYQNGQRMISVAKLNLAEDVLRLEHAHSTFTVYCNGSIHARFHDIPADWRLAVGGFGGGARLIRPGTEVGGSTPRIVLSDIRASSLPDAEQSQAGAGSDAYIQFELLVDDGPFVPPGSPECIVQTSTKPSCSSAPEWTDEALCINLPQGFVAGRLFLTAWDEDMRAGLDLLGSVTVPIQALPGIGPQAIDKLVIKGAPQHGGAGFTFPDFEVSFVYTWTALEG